MTPLERIQSKPLILGVAPKIYNTNRLHFNQVDFPFIRSVVQEAEMLGFDFSVSTHSWRPYTAETYYSSLQMAAALAVSTERMIHIGTVNPIIGKVHPLNFAREIATWDDITQGRLGINFVTSFEGSIDYDLFKQEETIKSGKFRLLDEFITKCEEYWQSPLFRPLPTYGLPIISVAGKSHDTALLAKRHAQMVFTAADVSYLPDALKSLPTFLSRFDGSIPFTTVGVVCRDTPKEVNQYLEQLVGSPVRYQKVCGMMGIGSNLEVIGTPDQVADQIKALNATGMRGMALQFPDFKKDMKYFVDKVTPLL